MATPSFTICRRCVHALRLPLSSSSAPLWPSTARLRRPRSAGKCANRPLSSAYITPRSAARPQCSRVTSSLGASILQPSRRPTHSDHVLGRQARRHFTSSSFQRSKVVLNPRKDDDGNDMLVAITPRASNRLSEIMTTDANPNLLLRVRVESGGCHGFQYLMSLVDRSKVDAEDDTIFESEDDKQAKVVMDEPSLELLKGSTVDYSMELIGSQFKIVGNPHASSSCGCGTSFDIKL